MEKSELIQKIIETLNRLPGQQLQEINDYAEFLLQRAQKKILSEEISNANQYSASYKFLEEDANLYTVNDIIEKYGK